MIVYKYLRKDASEFINDTFGLKNSQKNQDQFKEALKAREQLYSSIFDWNDQENVS